MADGQGIVMAIIALLGVGVALGALILTTSHRAEARMSKRIDALETNTKKDITDSEARLRDEIKASETRLREEITAVEVRTTAEIKASEVRLREEITAVEARTTGEIKASEARTGAKFEEVREQFGEVNEQFRFTQARTDAGFADVNEQLRTTNDRMTSIERQQARLGGLLEGLREAIFERVRR